MRKLKITELNRLSPKEFEKSKKTPIVVVLDNVRSLHNVGSVFRTADAFLVEAIYLCGITSTPPHAEIHKTALGAEDTVKWKYAKDITEVLYRLKEQKFTICAVEQAEGSTCLSDFKINKNQKTAIIFGNEVKGVQQKVIDLCDACIEIPQYGTKHSFNISVSAGIVMWELLKKLHDGLER